MVAGHCLTFLPSGSADRLIPPIGPNIELAEARERAMEIDGVSLAMAVVLVAADAHPTPVDGLDAPFALLLQIDREPDGEHGRAQVHRVCHRPAGGRLAVGNEGRAADIVELEPRLFADLGVGRRAVLSEGD